MTTTWADNRRGLVRACAATLPVLTGGVLAFLRSGMQPSTAAMVLVLTVVAAAATGDRIAGVLAALTAAASFDFFLTEPYLSFSIHHRDDVELALALVVVGLAVSEVAQWGQRQRAVAVRREGYLTGLSSLLELPADTRPEARTRAVAEAVRVALDADRVEWVAGHPRWNDAVVEADGTVRAGGRALPVQRLGLPTDGWTAVPVRRGGELVGHYRVSTATRVVRPTPEALRVAALLAAAAQEVDAVAKRSRSVDPR